MFYIYIDYDVYGVSTVGALAEKGRDLCLS